MNLPNPKTMTVIATLKHECNLKEKFETLPVNDAKCNSLESFKTLPNGIISIVRPPYRDHLKITIKLESGCKSVKLNKYSAQITPCKSLEEASEILEELKLEASDIRETLVNYVYEMPIKKDDLELIRSPDFIIEQKRGVCLLKYKKSQFRIQNNKVRQTSRCTEEAQEAYNEFVKELQTI